MDFLLFYGYEFLSAFIPFLIVFVVFAYIQKKKGLSISKVSYVIIVVFTIYIIGVYHFTGAGTLYNVLTYQLELRQNQLNFIPFSNDIDIVAYLLNILLFIPLGLLVPFIWKKINKFSCILGIGLIFSLVIEVSQLLNNRATDIDDLLLNTVGAIIGFVLYKLLDKFTKSKYQFNTVPIVVLMISILIPFIGRFLFFNEIGFARLLYGF